MSKVDQKAAATIAGAIGNWKPKLKVVLSEDGDSVIATAKSIDVDAVDLKKLAGIIDGCDATISFGRSGANFRMIIW